jgi:hypothetical protein
MATAMITDGLISRRSFLTDVGRCMVNIINSKNDAATVKTLDATFLKELLTEDEPFKPLLDRMRVHDAYIAVLMDYLQWSLGQYKHLAAAGLDTSSFDVTHPLVLHDMVEMFVNQHQNIHRAKDEFNDFNFLNIIRIFEQLLRNYAIEVSEEEIIMKTAVIREAR